MSSPGQRIEREFNVVQKGVGRPDFSEEVFRSNIRAGYPLQGNEQLNIYTITFTPIASAFSHVAPRLAPGDTAHPINLCTGIPMPAVIPVGHVSDWLMNYWAFDNTIISRVYIDTQLVMEQPIDSLTANYQQMIVGLGSRLIDPTGAATHLMDFELINTSSVSIGGIMMIAHVEEIVGSPPFPNTKDVKCKHCGHITKEVDATTTSNKCTKCGKTTRYFPPRRRI